MQNVFEKVNNRATYIEHTGIQSVILKTYIGAQQLLEDSFRLGTQILDSGFKPSIIIALWRGGTPIGTAVQELLEYHGIETDHIAIRTSSYAAAIDGRSNEIRIHGMSYLIKHVKHTDRLLIVDDVFDTGHTIKAVIEHLETHARRNTPQEIKVAVPYYKPTRNQTDIVPDYFLHETEEWLKYPHSLEGLSHEEIAENRPELYEIIKPHLKK
ncbi:phosphoribosyltransferase [Oleiphilus sp. HI0125]|uniref:phosphoribosyltransferase n=1 Tax=Oleiphilus sp. HI0125 TaxID=1822266 RepID=UPI003512679B